MTKNNLAPYPEKNNSFKVNLLSFSSSIGKFAIEKSLPKIFFIANSLDILRSSPENIRKKIGFELDQVQRGSNLSDFRPMIKYRQWYL